MPTTKGFYMPSRTSKNDRRILQPRNQNCKNASKIIKPAPNFFNMGFQQKNLCPNTLAIFWRILPIVRYWPFGGHGGVEGWP